MKTETKKSAAAERVLRQFRGFDANKNETLRCDAYKSAGETARKVFARLPFSRNAIYSKK